MPMRRRRSRRRLGFGIGREDIAQRRRPHPEARPALGGKRGAGRGDRTSLGSQHVARHVRRPRQRTKIRLYKGGIHRSPARRRSVGRVEGQLLEHPLHHRIKPTRADVFDRTVHLGRDPGQGRDAIRGESDRHLLPSPSGRRIAGSGRCPSRSGCGRNRSSVSGCSTPPGSAGAPASSGSRSDGLAM
jgi:hypothetical protein